MRIAAILQSLGWERSGQGKDGLGNKARLFRPKNISFLGEKVVTVVTNSPNLSQPQGGVVTPPSEEVTTSQPVTSSNEGGVTPSKPDGEGVSAKVSQPSQPLDQHFEYFSDQNGIKPGDRVSFVGSNHDYLDNGDVLDVKAIEGTIAICDHSRGIIIGIRVPIGDLRGGVACA